MFNWMFSVIAMMHIEGKHMARQHPDGHIPPIILHQLVHQLLLCSTSPPTEGDLLGLFFS